MRRTLFQIAGAGVGVEAGMQDHLRSGDHAAHPDGDSADVVERQTGEVAGAGLDTENFVRGDSVRVMGAELKLRGFWRTRGARGEEHGVHGLAVERVVGHRDGAGREIRQGHAVWKLPQLHSR